MRIVRKALLAAVACLALAAPAAGAGTTPTRSPSRRFAQQVWQDYAALH